MSALNALTLKRGLHGQNVNLLLTVQGHFLSLTSMHSAPDMSWIFVRLICDSFRLSSDW